LSKLGWVSGRGNRRSWRRGEQNTFVRPDGSIRYFDSIHEQSGWKHFLSEIDKTLSLEEQLLLWLARLQNLAGAIQNITAKGWEVELDCFTVGSEVLSLSNKNLRSLADLGLGLSLTLSGNDPEAHAESVSGEV
jgi:hypothetical protein